MFQHSLFNCKQIISKTYYNLPIVWNCWAYDNTHQKAQSIVTLIITHPEEAMAMFLISDGQPTLLVHSDQTQNEITYKTNAQIGELMQHSHLFAWFASSTRVEIFEFEIKISPSWHYIKNGGAHYCCCMWAPRAVWYILLFISRPGKEGEGLDKSEQVLKICLLLDSSQKNTKDPQTMVLRNSTTDATQQL